jgi:hypothetical protein
MVINTVYYKIDPAEIGGNELPFVLPKDEAAKLGPADRGTSVIRTLIGGKNVIPEQEESGGTK